MLCIDPSTIMVAAKPYSELLANAELPKYELLEIHRSKISLHCAKEGLATQQYGCRTYFQNWLDYPLEFIRPLTRER